MIKKAIFLSLLAGSLNLSAFDVFKTNTSFKSANYVSAELNKPSEFTFNFPDIDLIDQHNQSVEINELFNTENNVVFAFFFTHCVTVCTTVTLSLKSIQPHLPDDTQIALISIDPETDTPDILKTYAEQHRIKDANWHLLTGDNKQIINLQKRFEAYRGNKMNHNTSLFVKKAKSDVITEIKNNFSVIPSFIKNS